MTMLLALLLAAGPNDSRLNFQMMTSAAYQAFAQKADAICPARKLRYLHPADLSGLEESFFAKLSPEERRLIKIADPDFKTCPPAGLSCPAQRTLSAIADARMLDKFTRAACSAR
jgi:hypothetical protein